MRRFRIPLQILFYREDGFWIAHCLEFDIIGHGDDKPQAMSCLAEAIRIQAEISFETNNLKNLFSPADGEYFQMYASGDDDETASGELDVTSFGNSQTITFDAIHSRVYEPAGSDRSDESLARA